MCFVWIWEQTAIISLYSIDWLVFITETKCVYCAVRSTFYVLPTQIIYVFCVDLRTNSDYFTVQHWLVGFYNRDGQCLLRGTDWVFIYKIDVSSRLWVLTAIHSFSVLLCRDVERPVRSLCRTSTTLYTWSSLPCMLHLSPNFILSPFLTEQPVKPYASFFCPKTLPEGAWRRNLKSSKQSSISVPVPLSQCSPSVTVCTPAEALLCWNGLYR